MRARLLLTGLLHLVGAVALPAQQRGEAFIEWEPADTWLDADTSGMSESATASLGDYRYEGLAFGGVVFGALGAWAGSRISAGCLMEPGVPCPSNKAENAVALGLVGAVLGGGLGYLVGRFSPKKPPRIEPVIPMADMVGVPDSVRTRIGYQHWKGGAIGLAAGAALGALTAARLGDGCNDCLESGGSGVLTLSLAGAGAGSVLGFLIGLATPKYVWTPTGAH
jgi:hypothetical protein